MTIRNPLEWGAGQLSFGTSALKTVTHDLRRTEDKAHLRMPEVRRIGIADLREVLAKGAEDFGAHRTDVMFLCVFYPIIGVLLARMAAGYEMLSLIFPFMSGFALVGPVAAVGLHEMSRQREQGKEVTWATPFDVLRSHSLGAVALLGIMLVAIFAIWMLAAYAIYSLTLGPTPPSGVMPFLHDVFATPAGWAMIAIGMGVGFLFAVLVLAIGAVSFQMLLDCECGLEAAVWTSIRAVAANPAPMAAWGLIVVAGLVIGMIPALIGLAIVLPVLGHASWHLYRKLVEC